MDNNKLKKIWTCIKIAEIQTFTGIKVSVKYYKLRKIVKIGFADLLSIELDCVFDNWSVFGCWFIFFMIATCLPFIIQVLGAEA